MIPYSNDSLYDLANLISFKLYNQDTGTIALYMKWFDQALDNFNPHISYYDDESFKVDYPRYRMDSIINMALMLKEHSPRKAFVIMNKLFQWYKPDREFRDAYNEIVNG